MIWNPPSSRVLDWGVKAAALAALYFVLGRLALLLAIPPGYATAVWPAAGVALAAVLLFGWRLWPGVFVGSFLINISTSLDTASAGSILESVLPNVGIASGAALQAIVGAGLVRRFADFPSNFDRLRTIFGAIALGGPVACVVSATVGVVSLRLAGAIEAADLARNWGTWWLGDTIGVLVVLPLASAWGLELHRASRRTRLLISLPIAGALAMTVLAYLDSRGRELERERKEFERRAGIMAQTVEQAVLSHLTLLDSVAGLFEASGEVDRAQFRTFVAPIFKRHPDLHGLSWNALVPEQRRAALEEKGRKDGYSNFLITERDDRGELVPARARAEHVVVFYIEPYDGNEEALGFDLTSNPARASALAQARDTGQVVATAPIVLVQEPGQKPGFLLFEPIYRRGLAHHDKESRRRNLHSFISGVFRAEQMFAEALEPFKRENITFAISDTTDPRDARWLGGDPAWSDEDSPDRPGLTWSTDLTIASRRWTARFRPAAGYISAAQWGKVWLVLTGGLFSTSLLGAFVLVVAGRAAATERVNEQLRSEIERRQRAQTALGASQDRFRAVFENAAVGVALIDLDGSISMTNAAMQRMLRYSGEELATMTFAEFTHPDDVDADFELFGELLSETRRSYQMEKRYITKSGETVWGRLTSSLVFDAEGKPLFGVGLNEDITERKLAEQRAAHFSSFLESSVNEIYIFDPETLHFIDVNRGGRENLGYSLEELRELTPLDLKPEVTPDSFSRLLEPLRLGNREKVQFETLHLRKDGSRYPVEVHLQLIREGRPAFLAIILDITQRKASEQALLNTQFTVDHAADGIFWVDEDARFSYVNDAACAMSGFSREELLQMSVLDIDPNLSAETWPDFWQSIRSTDDQVIESLMTRRDGSQFPVEVAVSYLEVDGVGRCFASVRDTTERKKAEEARIQLETKVQEAQKLESLGLLAGGIAHDFNNLLVGVLGNADLALAQLPDSSPARGFLKDIETSAQRASDLSNQLLAYSGKGKFVVEPTDLSELVAEFSHLVEVSVSKKAAVRYDLNEDLPSLEADATQLRQVVLNLITNASEAIGDEVGVISIRTGEMHCSRNYLAETLTAEELVEGLYVFIEVSDTGTGMDKETRERIFDPFFTTKFTGRGLGLAAVLGIVRGHKGAIDVSSEPGRGTTVKVLFPASERSTPERTDKMGQEEIWKGDGTVLLVDDEPMVRRVSTSILEKLGFAVITAADGMEALEVYRERGNEITLVLLDLTMPRMGGAETLTELRHIDEDVRVILTSGYNEQETTGQLADLGLVQFIQKPYRLAALRDTIREILAA